MVDLFVEEGAGWVEAEAEDAVSGEDVAALLPLLGEGLAGGKGDFDGADGFGDVIGMDGGGGGWVEAGEDLVEVGRATCDGQVAEAVAEAGLNGR